jgi:hypothetical protein
MLIHGLDFRVNWKNFVVGSSFFIPCLDPKEAEITVLKTIKRLGYIVKTRVVVEKGIGGLRIWRIK